MKGLFVPFGVALVGVGLIAGTGVASASPEPPPGYETKTVKAAGLTVAIPETFKVIPLTRKQAKAFLDANPQARQAGGTVDILMKQFRAVGDTDGDGTGEIGIGVQVRPEPGGPSPTQAREQLIARGYREVSASKTRVAGRRALVADYVGERTLEDGTTSDIHFTEYAFKSPVDAVVHIIFDRLAADTQYEDMIDTTINSVRFVKR